MRPEPELDDGAADEAEHSALVVRMDSAPGVRAGQAAKLPPFPAGGGEKHPTVSSALLPLLRTAAPLSCANLFNAAIPFISVIFTAHIGQSEVGASGVATMIANVTGYSLGIGLLTAMDTLASQAYGAGNYARVGVTLQRSLLLLGILLIPLCVMWSSIYPVLVFLKQPPEVCQLATLYARVLTLGLVPYFGFEALRRFLQCQKITQPMMYVSVITLALHPLVNWLLIVRLKLGYVGAPLAVVTTQWFMFLGLLGYTLLCRPHHPRSWPGFSREAFKEMPQYLRLAVPGASMLLGEWWAWEAVGLGIGTLGVLALSTHNVLLQCMIFTYRVPLGIAIGVNVHVGNLLGAGMPTSARSVAWAGFLLQFCASVVIGPAIYFSRFEIPKMFTDDPELRASLSSLLSTVVFFMVLDGYQCIGQGMFRGTGKQLVGAYLAFVGYYFVGIPAAFALGYPAHWGLRGMYTGCMSGYVVVGLLTVVAMVRMDWADVSAKAIALAQVLEAEAEEEDEDDISAHGKRRQRGADAGLASDRSTEVETELHLTVSSLTCGSHTHRDASFLSPSSVGAASAVASSASWRSPASGVASGSVSDLEPEPGHELEEDDDEHGGESSRLVSVEFISHR